MSSEKINAIVKNKCYRCEERHEFSSASGLIRHMKVYHDVELPSRLPGNHRPPRTKYKFMTSNNGSCVPLLGCPSCWFYCGDLNFKRLETHIKDCHINYNDEEDPEDPEDDDTHGYFNYDSASECNEEYDKCSEFKSDSSEKSHSDNPRHNTDKAIDLIMEGIKRLLFSTNSNYNNNK